MRLELEAALLADWTRDNLAVYGDYLQSQGDVRGELIALDLQLARDPHAEAPALRRSALLASLIGDASDLHASWFQFGFAHPRLTSAHQGSRLASLAETPFAAFVRTLWMHGAATWIKQMLGELARSEHRWLHHITLDFTWGGTSSSTALLSARTTKTLVEATPNLDAIEIRGFPLREVFPSFKHPRARLIRSKPT